MTASAHALVGAAIATKIANPAIGLPICFLSHFVLDKIPHWDVMYRHQTKTRRFILVGTALDLALGYLLILVFFSIAHQPPLSYLLLAAFISQLPDFLEAPYSLLKLQWPFSYANYRLQHKIHDIWFNARLAAPWGIVTQVGVVFLILLWANS